MDTCNGAVVSIEERFAKRLAITTIVDHELTTVTPRDDVFPIRRSHEGGYRVFVGAQDCHVRLRRVGCDKDMPRTLEVERHRTCGTGGGKNRE